MMASNLLSRLLPPGNPSIYEAMREQDDFSDTSDIEERSGMALDEENLGDHIFDIDPALADAMEAQIGIEDSGRRHAEAKGHRGRSPRWAQPSSGALEPDEADDDVPASLLIETNQGGPSNPLLSPQSRAQRSPRPVPVAGQASGAIRAKWNATQQQQRLHEDPHILPAYAGRPNKRNMLMIDPKEKALWRWANVQNLDNFLQDVYEYFVGHGIWSILLSGLLNLLTIAFVVSFTVFLSSCLDYRKLSNSKEMSDILIPKCTQKMSGLSNLLIWVCAFLWISRLFKYVMNIRRLRHMHDFFHYLLEIPDTDIQTVSWQEVVKRLMALRDLNPSTAENVSKRHHRFLGTQSKQRMDAHDIANRLMRRDNYLIALINKETLDITLPVPFLANRPLFSRTLEWNLSLCILDYVFNEQGQVKPLFLRDTHRRALSEGLRRRFIFAGLMNVICAPFIIIYLSVSYFFMYYNEYQKNPSSIGSRQYTPLAEWKFREFNELWHLFERRVKMSYPFATRYINQFPKVKTVQLAQFIQFVAGAIVAVLAAASLLDSESLLGFEITPERTVLFYLTLFGVIWTVAKGATPEQDIVFDPEFALSAVINFTHYSPNHWRGRLHSDEVRKDFAQLYQMKLVIFLEELFSIITTPFILWFSLPKCSDRIVDFFREFTLHVDGLGHVCSFAVFEFDKGASNNQRQKQKIGGEEVDLREDYYSTKDGKMLASYYNFMDNYVNEPKHGVPYQQTAERPFHPPPTFPGMMSSNLMGDGTGPVPTRNEPWNHNQRSSNRHVFGNNSVAQRAPRFAPNIGQSPMASLLLDPHHQPNSATMKPSHRASAPSRLRANSRKPIADVIEDDEDASEQQGGPSRGSESAGQEDSNNLGESWKTTRAGLLDEEDDGTGAGRSSAGATNGAGVLGLVYQFSKAQTEGRGTGVQI